MKRSVYQVIRDYDNELIGLVPIHGGQPIPLMQAIEDIGGDKWVGIPDEDGNDVRVAQVVIEIREHKVRAGGAT
jgi:hypothetical protein